MNLELLKEINKAPVLRLLLDNSEIKDANALVKLGYVRKGHSDTKQANVQFCITEEGEMYIALNER